MQVADRLSAWLPVLWFLLVVLILVWLVSSRAIEGLLRRITKFGGFGVEFQFTEETAQKTRVSIEAELQSVRDTIRRELGAEVRARGIPEKLKSVLQSIDELKEGSYRATIHIRDPLYDNWLFQLVNYYPKGDGRGRAFSARAGIIGMAWRCEQDRRWFQADPPGGEQTTKQILIEKWGMTSSEADERRVDDKTKVMLALLLWDENQTRPLGVLYLDSKEQDLFGAQDHGQDPEEFNEAQTLFKDSLLAAYNDKLAGPLNELVEATLRKSPQLSLEQS